jgi:hypothetical protein
VTELHSPVLLRQNDDSAQIILQCHGTGMRCRWYHQRTGILTCFPFVRAGLRADLGPTYPQLTIIAEETVPFRRNGFSPFFAVTFGRIFISERSTGTYAPASAPSERLPTLPPVGGIRGIGSWFSPVHFRRLGPRRVSCYAFFKGWLLLSLPPRCLWL